MRKDDIFTHQDMNDYMAEQFELHVGKYSCTIQHEMTLSDVGHILQALGRVIVEREKKND